MLGFFVLMLMVGLAMVVGPFFIEVPLMARLILMMLGNVLIVVSILLLAIFRWYRKATADEAIVRTGSGGTKVIVDGGILVLPNLHSLIRVPLKVKRFAVDLKGSDGAVTKDKSKLDMHSEFYVRVGATPEQVLNASRLFGDQAGDNTFMDMVQTKLTSVLRSTAAKYSLSELDSDSEVFTDSVKKSVAKEIESDGLVLATAAISKTPIIGI